tara:strand:+ start:550 stop:744 length:195 start_codon:yes stop_codon:yes gene_type:complete
MNKKIKFLKPNLTTGLQRIKLSNKNGHMVTYKPYTICQIANSKFGTEEVTSWFNYKGLTYIADV